jgi:hypothetical protein
MARTASLWAIVRAVSPRWNECGKYASHGRATTMPKKANKLKLKLTNGFRCTYVIHHMNAASVSNEHFDCRLNLVYREELATLVNKSHERGPSILSNSKTDKILIDLSS